MDKLARTAAAAGDDVKVIAEGTLGCYLMFGDVAARLVGVAPDDGSWDNAVRAAFGLDDIRDVQVESGYAIDQLENIAWVAASSAQQSPRTAITAVRALHDLLSRWLVAGERDRSDRSTPLDELPIVYVDGAVLRILAALATAVVASAESRQAHTCAEILRTFAGVTAHLRDDDRATPHRAGRHDAPAVG